MALDEKIKYNINDAYEAAVEFAGAHYENFPVISFLIPKRLRKHVAIIYWFARTADDFADEGRIIENERKLSLDGFENFLKSALDGDYENMYFFALSNTIRQFKLTPVHFFDLLKAFKQDVRKRRYRDFNEVLDYCRCSANPVGRLILELFGIRNDEAFLYSDKICTALQLTNFYQDAAIDYKKDRIYLAQDEMEKFKVDNNVFELNENNLNFKELLKYNVDRAQQLFDDGKKLFGFLHGKLKFEIKWTVYGGEEILSKIRNSGYCVLQNRPELSKSDFVKLFVKVLLTNE